MYWDGAQWVGTPVPAPQPQAASPAPLTAASLVDEVIGRAKSAAADPKVQGTAMAAGGATAVAHGLFGLGGKPGLGAAVAGVGFGVVWIVLTVLFFGVFESLSQAEPKQPNEETATVQVVDIQYTPRDRDGDSYCIPAVELEGAMVTPQVPAQIHPCPVRVGKQVEVYYVPGNPETARFTEAYSVTIQPFIRGMKWIFVAVGGYLVVSSIGRALVQLGWIAGGGWLLWLGIKRRKDAGAAGQ